MPAMGRCETCPTSPIHSRPLCIKCLPDHPRHTIYPIGELRQTLATAGREAWREDKGCYSALLGIHHMAERIDASIQGATNEVRAEMHRHMSALEERKRDLLQSLHTMKQSKQTVLAEQGRAIGAYRNQLSTAVKLLDSVSDKDGDSALLPVFEQLVRLFSTRAPPLDPNENDMIHFQGPEPQLHARLRSLGNLESGPSVATSLVIGEVKRRLVLEQCATIQVQLRDASDAEMTVTGYAQCLGVRICQPDGSALDLSISERSIGLIDINFVPKLEGLHIVHITLYSGAYIKGAPLELEVRRGRNYREILDRGELFHFGREGSGDGELCRPWGISCDKAGRIIVADRSNNRVQVFDSEGKFLLKFGTGGTRPGQFDRPAGICVNSINQIIVADKDNHRIQVFDSNGVYVFMFGERGRPTGMFNYPWGVATDHLDQIAVSDTRNHRVQLFSPTGQYLAKCGFDTAYFFKHLDSPRGVCFLPDSRLLITDFNNHRIVMMATGNGPDLNMKCFGSEGDGEGMLLRPQGLALDQEGHLLVCDSRNNRIQVFVLNDMRCAAIFGGPRIPSARKEDAKPAMGGGRMPTMFPDFTSPPPVVVKQGATPQTSNDSVKHAEGVVPELDRPTDLCVGLDGRVYVVDLGNNCIRVF
ncbi:unnamed protein product, partial [Mesorhabditis spiculigera]